MSAHVFTFDQVQFSIAEIARKAKESTVYLTEEEHALVLEEELTRKTSQRYKNHHVWFTKEGNVIAFEESTGFLRVWGWNFEPKFFVVDEEAFKASTEGIETAQGDLELLLDSLWDKNYTFGYEQLQLLP